MVLGRIPSNVQPAFLAKRRRERVLGKTKHTVTEGARKKSKKPAKVRFRVKSAAAAPVEATANPEVPVASSSQVATEPATPTPSASASASLPPPPQPVTVKLPTTLKHPTMREVTSEAMAAVGVECTGVPTQFLRDKLAIHSPAWFDVVKSMKPQTAPPKGILPADITVLVEGIAPSHAPTHMLAVRAPNSNNATLYPCHSLVLAAHCSRLTPFDTTKKSITMSASSCVLPVRWLTLPDPTTFPMLLQYLYTKRPEVFFSAPFLPESLSLESSASQKSLATMLVKKYSSETLMRNATAVWGLWSNGCALGVLDEILWQSIDRLWGTILLALSLAPGSNAKFFPKPVSSC